MLFCFADIEKSASKEKYLKRPRLLTAYMEWYAHRGSNWNVGVILLKRKANVGLTNADGKGWGAFHDEASSKLIRGHLSKEGLGDGCQQELTTQV